jgi:hypothetical protein
MEFVNKIVEFFKSAHVEMWVVFLLVTVEYWLGKTEIVKPGSTLEMILATVKKVAEFLKGLIIKK